MIISMSSTLKSGGYNLSTWVVYASSIPLLLCIILWFCMRSAGSMLQFMGKSGIEATSRIMRFLLVCVGAQFIINGVKELILSFPNI